MTPRQRQENILTGLLATCANKLVLDKTDREAVESACGLHNLGIVRIEGLTVYLRSPSKAVAFLNAR